MSLALQPSHVPVPRVLHNGQLESVVAPSVLCVCVCVCVCVTWVWSLGKYICIQVTPSQSQNCCKVT